MSAYGLNREFRNLTAPAPPAFVSGHDWCMLEGTVVRMLRVVTTMRVFRGALFSFLAAIGKQGG